MAPVASVVVYHVGRYGDIVADSLLSQLMVFQGTTYVGLVVFSDAVVPKDQVSAMQHKVHGMFKCSPFYSIKKKCDGQLDCEDGTDEANCDLGKQKNWQHSVNFDSIAYNDSMKMFGFGRYIILPHGRFIFTEEVPERPAHWMVQHSGLALKLLPGALTATTQPTFIGLYTR
ncbi:Protein of unknown function, partial [Gryllus bimaculatus]